MTPEERVLENNRLIRERRTMALEQARVETLLRDGAGRYLETLCAKPTSFENREPQKSKYRTGGDVDVMNQFMPIIISAL